jgi:hypothetical protein
MDHIFAGEANIGNSKYSPCTIYGFPVVQGQAEVAAIRFSPASLPYLEGSIRE